MYYNKQIRYIDYLENGEKQSNCGYVKITVTDNRLLLEMQIRGLYETDDVASEVALEGAGAERRIGTVLIRQGSGSFRWEVRDPLHAGEELSIGEGLSYGQLERVHVQLSPRRRLRCVWRESAPKPQTVRQEYEAGDVGQGMSGYKHGDGAQTGSGAEGSQSDAKKAEASESLGLNTRQPLPDVPGRAGDRQVNNLGASVLETAAEEHGNEAERDNERILAGRTEAERSNERTLTGRTAAERDNERTLTGRTAAERDGEGTAPNRTGAERGREGIWTDKTVRERDGEGTAPNRTAEQRGSESTLADGAVAENTLAKRDEADRTETEGSIMTEADWAENEMENPSGEKIPGMAASETEGRKEAAVEEAELHQTDASDVPGENGIAPESRRTTQLPHMAAMSEDKWQQLWKIYPHIRPFQDDREYLSLRPEDFVILHSGAYRLAQNSFLLHGYFNYKHLILTQVSQRNGNQYYIGVPGNFYEKEKQVAIMYGFGSFECRQEPAQEGDFGYYMIKVEL